MKKEELMQKINQRKVVIQKKAEEDKQNTKKSVSRNPMYKSIEVSF
jgi:hypothetical protein